MTLRLPTPDIPRLRNHARPVVESLVHRSPVWRRLADVLDRALAPPPGQGADTLGDVAHHALAAVVADYRYSLDGVMRRVDSGLMRLLDDVDRLRGQRGRGGRSPEAVAADMQGLAEALQEVRTLRQHLTEALADTDGPLPARLRHEIAGALGAVVPQGSPRSLAGSRPARPGIRPRVLAPSVTGRALVMSGETAGTGGIRAIHGTRLPDGSSSYQVTGEILDSIPRGQAPNFQNRIDRGGPAGLPGYERAHLWGPGFGDEAADGLMYAPRSVNQLLQNLGIEGVIRQTARDARALGGHVFVEAVAVSHPPGTRGLPPGLSGEALAQVQYRLYVQPRRPGPRHHYYTVSIEVSPTGHARVDAPSYGGFDPAYVPEGSYLPPRPRATPTHRVFINEPDVDARELARIPGIGPVLGERIARFLRERRRERPGHPISSVDDLLAVEGVRPSTVEAMRPLVDVSPSLGGAR